MFAIFPNGWRLVLANIAARFYLNLSEHIFKLIFAEKQLLLPHRRAEPPAGTEISRFLLASRDFSHRYYADGGDSGGRKWS